MLIVQTLTHKIITFCNARLLGCNLKMHWFFRYVCEAKSYVNVSQNEIYAKGNERVQKDDRVNKGASKKKELLSFNRVSPITADAAALILMRLL